MDTQMTLSLGDQARDRGIAQVLANNTQWREYAMSRVAFLPPGWTGTGEDIRALVGADPSHPNAWGALIRTAVLRGHLEPTGEYVKPRDPKSHSRKVQVYRVAA